jgi:hypothetical protein
MGPPESADSHRFLARFAAFVSLAVGLFVFAGWLFDLEQLTNIAPGWPRMPMLTAAAIMLAGVALWLTTLRAVPAATTAAGLLTAIGVLILLRDASGWNAHLEQFTLAALPTDSASPPPARMAPAAASAFVLFGLSLILA